MEKVTSGSITTNASYNRSITLSWSKVHTDIKGNYDDINWTLKGSGTGLGWIKAGNFKVIIAGEQVYYSTTRINLYNNTHITSGTKRIYHNNAGKGSFEAYCEAGIYEVAVNCTARGNWELPDIPRWASIKTANNFNDEENPSCTFENLASIPVNIKLEFGGLDPVINRNNVSSTTSGKYTFILTDNERNLIRSKMTSNSMSVRYTVYSSIGEKTNYSYLDKTVTLINGNPVFNDFEVYDTDPRAVQVLGDNKIFLQGLSDLKVKITTGNKMVAQKNATAVKYVASLENTNQNINYSTSQINAHLLYDPNFNGNKTVIVRAYDSRNNSTPVNKTITILPYNPPVINGSLTRLNNFENETTLKINGSYQSIKVNNVEKNTLKYVKYRYKKEGGTWGTYVNVPFTKSGTNYTCNNQILNLDNAYTYDFEILIEDNVKTQMAIAHVDVGKSIMFINKDGGVDIEGNLNVNGDIIKNGKSIFNLIYPVGAIYMSTSSTNPASLFGGTWESWGDGRVPVGVDISQGEFNSVEKIGGEKTHKLTINEMPRHFHDFKDTGRNLMWDSGLFPMGGLTAGTTVQSTWSTYTADTGGDEPHNNLQPYITCYMWRRTT